MGQSVVILLEDMRSGFWRFTADIQAALGLTSVTSPAGIEDVVASNHDVIEPDPLPSLPPFGNWPRLGRLADHSCGPVETYFHVRTKKYITTRVKARSKPRMFEFLGADMIRGAQNARDICAHPDGILASPAYQRLYTAALAAHKKERKLSPADAKKFAPPFIVCINFALPRAPTLAPHEYVNIVTYFGRQGTSDNAEWEGLWERFLKMTPQQRGSRFKLLPAIVNGPSMFQNSIANKPALIGNKLKCSWFESPNHLECIVEVGTSLLASNMWRLMLSQSKQLAMDMAWVIQGEDEAELPEVVLGAFHLSKPDLGAYRTLSPRGVTVVEPAPVKGRNSTMGAFTPKPRRTAKEPEELQVRVRTM
ncbi:hypothetical protein T492DRAFT_1109703 [Pavlovales sp. CCMP2436]|nr:hypothetical protein T492DRAFT_1109703 [Pavlovales sp. CCMP2436]